MVNQPLIIHDVPNGTRRSPIVFDTPHSGTVVPSHFDYICEPSDFPHLSDLHVEKFLAGIPATGSPVLEMLIHRACIDLNRSEDELNPAALRDSWTLPYKLTPYVQEGFGLFAEYVRHPDKGMVNIFNENLRPDSAEVQNRIVSYHRPYYETLQKMLHHARDEHGFALYCDMHSMRRRFKPEETHLHDVDIVLGDLNGTACSPALIDFAAAYFEQAGYKTSRNDPFSGANLLRQFSTPDDGIHCIQIEVVRDQYMNPVTLEIDAEKMERLQSVMTGFSSALRDYALNHAAEFMPETLREKTLSHASSNALSNASMGTSTPVSAFKDVTP